ncbi:MAG: type IV pilus secretin PilQ family protein [Dokdonella sp.]
MSNTEFDARSSGATGALRRRTVATAFACLGWLALAANAAHAANALKDVAYTALPGGKVELRLSFDSPPALPNGFTTDTPPTIALDFADTRNDLGKRRVEVSTGATSALNIVEAGGRTRVVIGLFRPASYVSRIIANQLVVTVNNGVGESANYVAAASAGNPTKTVAATSRSNTLNNIDFRRGKDGEGRIVLSFAQAGAAVDLKREGDRIVLDLLNIDVPPAQARKLDVTDFATPVRSVDAHNRNGRAQLEIIATPPFEQSAYQAGNDYVLEIGPKKADDKIATRDVPPVYNGTRVTFNFQDIPVRSVLQLIAEESNFNIVVADSVTGNVTLRLLNVPWDQALDLVLRAKGLDKRSQGNVIWVGPQKEIADHEQALADARMKRMEQDELVSDIIPISYGKAKDIVELLTKDTQSGQTAGGGQGQTNTAQRGFLSTRGSVTYDERTNTLLISDTPAKIAEIRQLVATLDRPVQQVLIESRIVIATDSFARELGAKFGISGGYTDNNGNVVGVSGNAASAGSVANQAYLNRLGVGGLGGTSPIGDPLLTRDRLNVNLPAAAGGGGSFGLAILGADYLLDLELSANQTEGRTEVLSSPRVVTANNTEAVIKQGQEIGYVTVQGGAGGVDTATVQFKEAVLELKVTPTITADDRVYLNLNVKKDALNRFVDNPGGGQVPQLDKREVTTGVLVDNGQTVVLGGVYEVSKADSQTKVPLLGDIPVLGNLFRKKGRNDTKAELLIFVTPRILSDSLK